MITPPGGNGHDDSSKKKYAPTPPSSTLTTRQGRPVHDNQSSRTVGNRGPTVMENYQLLEKITHFDRERIPERVVHARGAGAHGSFEAFGTIGNEPISKYTRAKLFQKRVGRHRCSYASPPSFTAGIPPEPCATRAVLPRNFIPKMAIGILSETT